MTTPSLIQNRSRLVISLCVSIVLISCGGIDSQSDSKNQIGDLKSVIKEEVKEIMLPEGLLSDSSRLHSAEAVAGFYRSRNFRPAWVEIDSVSPAADSLIQLIQKATLWGLFPENYHNTPLRELKNRFSRDTSGMKEAKGEQIWATMDLLLTDAFLTLARHLERGHTPIDSLQKIPSFTTEPYLQALNKTIETQDPQSALEKFEPLSLGYQNLKKALPGFLQTANLQKQYTYLEYPFRDSVKFIDQLVQRLKEENYLDSNEQDLDTASLSRVLKKVQTARKLKVDGKYGPQLVRSLNEFDQEKFMKVAINMDRYRMERDTLPARYLLVNLPAFSFTIYDQDTVALESRVIIGKPQTPTPLLSSKMNQVIVFPTWTIPASIIADEILPILKRDPGYLARKGYRLYTFSGEEVDPWTVDWSKYKKGVPYKIVQGEGIGNALGVMKFNFPNKHDVYLHDTNQRSLFANENRSLSHGCVRVQNWERLYRYVIGLDSMQAANESRPFIPTDSVRHWLTEKKRRVIPLKNQLPILFRYYTAASKNGKLETYHDVYGKDDYIRNAILQAKR